MSVAAAEKLEAADFMSEIGLFPLELVLLPGERVPLHIFEDRYRDLIGECMAEDSEFGLILETEDGLREVGTKTAIVELIDTFDDGRMNVLVEGRERFRVVELTEGRTFLTAEIEELEDDGELPEADEVDHAVDVFRRLVAVAEADEIDEPEAESTALSFELASRVDFGHDLKQELLELRSERVRLKRLSELLEEAVEALAREREVRQRASGNGKVSAD
jgi:Lon protease-like protein